MSHCTASCSLCLTVCAQGSAVSFEKVLGSGVFGDVWQATWRGTQVAAKVTGCPTGFRAEELVILRLAQGSHTVKLLSEERSTVKGTGEQNAKQSTEQNTEQSTEQNAGWLLAAGCLTHLASH